MNIFMSQTDTIIYKLLIVGTPILLSILSFIGILAVKALIQMSNDLGSIKVTIGEIAAKHDNLEKRVDKVEKKLFHCD